MSKQALRPVVPKEAGQYPGEWVALHPETREVVAHNKNLKAVTAEAERKGIDGAVFHGVPKESLHRHYRLEK